MKNVLFIGPYYHGTNLGLTAFNYIKALQTIPNVNLAIRPLYSNKPLWVHNDDTLSQLEHVTYKNYDHIFLCASPKHLVYRQSCSGITVVDQCTFETHSDIIERYRHMDNIIVSSYYEQQILKHHIASNKIHIIPTPIDIDSLYQQYTPPFTMDKTFTFYYVGSADDINHIQSLLIAFYRTFNNNTNVRLAICFVEYPDNKLVKSIKTILTDLKSQYSNSLSTETVQFHWNNWKAVRSYHAFGNCFVSAASGGGCNPHVIEAMLFGNAVIVNKESGLYSVSISNGSYQAHETPILLPHYEQKGTWHKLDILSLQNKMQHVYKNQLYFDENARYRQRAALNHSFKCTGQYIQAILKKV